MIRCGLGFENCEWRLDLGAPHGSAPSLYSCSQYMCTWQATRNGFALQWEEGHGLVVEGAELGHASIVGFDAS